jgi:hypothetical protein
MPLPLRARADPHLKSRAVEVTQRLDGRRYLKAMEALQQQQQQQQQDGQGGQAAAPRRISASGTPSAMRAQGPQPMAVDAQGVAEPRAARRGAVGPSVRFARTDVHHGGGGGEGGGGGGGSAGGGGPGQPHSHKHSLEDDGSGSGDLPAKLAHHMRTQASLHHPQPPHAPCQPGARGSGGGGDGFAGFAAFSGAGAQAAARQALGRGAEPGSVRLAGACPWDGISALDHDPRRCSADVQQRGVPGGWGSSGGGAAGGEPAPGGRG